MKKAGNIFGIIVGFCMIGMWAMLFVTGQVKELADEPFRITAHLFSEGITAASLILGGLLSLKHQGLGDKLHLVSLGMLLYSVLTAGGYYLQLNNMAMIILFGTLIITTVVFITANLLQIKNSK
jgi:hypothetical protein